MTQLGIFDLDGTLVDTPRAIVETFTATFQAVGTPAREPAEIRATIGLPLEKAFGGLLGVASDDALVTEAVRQYQVLFRELILPRAKQLVFPGVIEGLATLSERDFLLAVATSKFRSSADALLAAAGLDECFQLVVGADEVTNPKPHPEMGQLIMRTLGVPAGNSVMVGDTTHDLLMARAAGMRSIAVTYGVHDVGQLRSCDPTWLAATFAEVVDQLSATRDQFSRDKVTGGAPQPG